MADIHSWILRSHNLELSRWQHCKHWQHQRLSLWQNVMPPVTTKFTSKQYCRHQGRSWWQLVAVSDDKVHQVHGCYTPTDLDDLITLHSSAIIYILLAISLALRQVTIIVSSLVQFYRPGILSWQPIPFDRCHSMMDCCVLWQGSEMMTVMGCDRLPLWIEPLCYYFCYLDNGYSAGGER